MIATFALENNGFLPDGPRQGNNLDFRGSQKSEVLLFVIFPPISTEGRDDRVCSRPRDEA